MNKSSKKLIAVLLTLAVLVGVACPVALAVSGKIDGDIIAQTSQTAVKIESEGIVLLKNEGGFLPLNGKKLNIFGAGSVTPLLGGAGSGAITSENPVTFYDALDAEGIEYNSELRAVYEKYCGSNEMPKTDNTVINNLLQLMLTKSTLTELPAERLTDKLMSAAADYSDTALIMLSRTGIEGGDLAKEDARLREDEKALVEKVTAQFDNVIVLFNISNIIEMGWLEDYDSIKSAAIIWIPGEFGMTAVAKMLKGEVNPSGRLADTVAYSMDDYPANECFGSHEYNGAREYYVEYLEGIYVGYRYFETFAKDKVQYPFGYGKSYTDFDKQAVSFNAGSGKIAVEVRVTNTGSFAGKDCVQVYYSAPYADGGIEKSAINLAGYAKTSLLAPGESETLIVEFNADDMASYDYKNRQAWVLDGGVYRIIVADNVREHIASYDYTVDETRVIKNDSVTGAQINNLFADAYSGFTVLSRSSPEATYPEFRALEATPGVKNPDELPEPTAEGTAPATGVKHAKTIKLRDVYEDESLWDDFLDQMTVDEMAALVSNGGYETYGIDRLGIPHTWDNDGPSSIKGRNGLLYVDSGTAYPCETAIACTWNDELAYAMGSSVGMEAADIGVDIWYAPGVNIHRSPLGGRNFEYFSEDPFISGKMASAVIRGAQSEGLMVTVKHFALNDQESHRNGIFTWADEQTMREIYLKAFEIAIKESRCCGVMSAYNRIGTDWCGASSELLIDLLRTEWGFEGFVLSDFSSNVTGYGYMSPVLAVYNGNNALLTGITAITQPSHMAAVKLAYRRDPIGFGTALRESCKNLCIAKMRTKAFLTPDDSYDASLIGAMVKPDEWQFEQPYIFSVLRYILNNIVNVVLYGLRYIL